MYVHYRRHDVNAFVYGLLNIIGRDSFSEHWLTQGALLVINLKRDIIDKKKSFLYHSQQDKPNFQQVIKQFNQEIY